MKSAHIRFLTSEEGGRSENIPDGKHRYCTIGMPPELGRPPWKEAWSIVVEFDEPPATDRETKCKVNYLAYTHPKCPQLLPRTKLDMFEGSCLVAHVEVL